MPNFRDWTASEICMQYPAARNILAKHFGPEGIGTGSGAKLRDLAARKSVDLSSVLKDLDGATRTGGGLS